MRPPHYSLLALLLTASSAPQQLPTPPTEPSQPPQHLDPSGTKLDLDPTERIDISGWWRTDREIILIKPDGAFVRWNQPNRFRAPSEMGRWDRQNYRTFWLEPYPKGTPNLEAPSRIRAALRRTNGKLFFDLGIVTGFTRCDGPPKAPEDQFVGRWLGPGGSLTLLADGTYSLSANTSATDAPVVRAAHAGKWSLDGKKIVLLPQGTEDDPVVCTQAGDDRLVGPLGELTRVKPEKVVPGGEGRPGC